MARNQRLIGGTQPASIAKPSGLPPLRLAGDETRTKTAALAGLRAGPEAAVTD